MLKHDIKGLYYITHVANVESILKNGILSHAQIEKRGIKFTRIYDEEIVSRRRDKIVPGGGSLWTFANLYFQPRNPMLYRVINERELKDIAVVCVRPQVLKLPNVLVSTGNAASGPTEILPGKEGLRAVLEMG